MSEYCEVGGAIKAGTMNVPKIDGAIKPIAISPKYIFACEQASDRLYGIDDQHANLAGWPLYGGGIADPTDVACDADGNSYWACAYEVRKYGPDGVLAWAYTTYTVPVASVCVDADGNVYSGDHNGTVKKLSSAGSLVWTRTPYAGSVFALAVDYSTGQLYAAYGIGAAGRIIRFFGPDGNYVNIYYQAAVNFTSIAIDEVTPSLYIGDNAGHVRKISTAGYSYYDQDKGGYLYAVRVGHDGYGYYTNGAPGDVGKFTLATGVDVWVDPHSAGTSYGLAVDRSGNVYSSHGAYGSVNAVIRKKNSSGVEQWTWQPYVNATWRGVAVSPGIKAAGFD